jgi:hypothetical protein
MIPSLADGEIALRLHLTNRASRIPTESVVAQLPERQENESDWTGVKKVSDRVPSPDPGKLYCVTFRLVTGQGAALDPISRENPFALTPRPSRHAACQAKDKGVRR